MHWSCPQPPGWTDQRGDNFPETGGVGVEDLWFAIPCQRHLQGIETELRVKAARELPAEHVSGEQIHDRHQIEESLLQRDIGDIGSPDLIHSRDLLEVHQTGKSLGWISWDCGSGLLVDRP